MPNEKLKKEGFARDIVRRIQNQRKEANYEISDFIKTYYEAGKTITNVFESFGELIAAETLSISIENKKSPKEAYIVNYVIGKEKLKIGLIKARKKSRP
jgi:isoleucyl-tRNA synthetase